MGGWGWETTPENQKKSSTIKLATTLQATHNKPQKRQKTKKKKVTPPINKPAMR